MNLKKVKTTSQAENYCIGLINDFESGIIDKTKVLKKLRDYTLQIHDVFFEVAKREVKKDPKFFEKVGKRKKKRGPIINVLKQ
jgi:hypothetical protein